MNFVESLELFHVSAKEIPCLTGKGAPTARTEGATGVLYMDIDTGDLYKCRGGERELYRWEIQGGNGTVPVKGRDYYTEADKMEMVAMVLAALGGKVISGYVDAENNIIINNLPAGDYTVKYEMADGSTLEIGDLVLDTNAYFSITNTLINCVSSNSAVQAAAGEYYEAVISANGGYELESVVVTMGGMDISSTAVIGGRITIANVTGNIVITAVAEEVSGGYTNLADPTSSEWIQAQRISASQGTISGGMSEDTYVSNCIPAAKGDVVRVSGGVIDHTYGHGVYGTDKTTFLYTATIANGGAYWSYTNNKVTILHDDVAFIRFTLREVTDKNAVIITVNEKIV